MTTTTNLHGTRCPWCLKVIAPADAVLNPAGIPYHLLCSASDPRFRTLRVFVQPRTCVEHPMGCGLFHLDLTLRE